MAQRMPGAGGYPAVLTLLGRGCCSDLLWIMSFSQNRIYCEVLLLAQPGVLWERCDKHPHLAVAEHSSSRWFSFPSWLFLILSGLQELPSPFSHYSLSLAAVPPEPAILIRRGNPAEV